MTTILPGVGITNVLDPVTGAFAGHASLQQAFQNYANQFNSYLGTAVQGNEDRARANLVKAGLSGDPSGQDILARSNAAVTGALLPQYTQQALGMAEFAVNLINALEEAARERQARQELQNNELAVQERLARAQALEWPLELMEKRLPLDLRAFRESSNLTRELFPEQFRTPSMPFDMGMGSAGGMTAGGGFGGSGFDNLWDEMGRINDRWGTSSKNNYGAPTRSPSPYTYGPGAGANSPATGRRTNTNQGTVPLPRVSRPSNNR